MPLTILEDNVSLELLHYQWFQELHDTQYEKELQIKPLKVRVGIILDKFIHASEQELYYWERSISAVLSLANAFDIQLIRAFKQMNYEVKTIIEIPTIYMDRKVVIEGEMSECFRMLLKLFDSLTDPIAPDTKKAISLEIVKLLVLTLQGFKGAKELELTRVNIGDVRATMFGFYVKYMFHVKNRNMFHELHHVVNMRVDTVYGGLWTLINTYFRDGPRRGQDRSPIRSVLGNQDYSHLLKECGDEEGDFNEDFFDFDSGSSMISKISKSKTAQNLLKERMKELEMQSHGITPVSNPITAAQQQAAAVTAMVKGLPW